MDNPFFSPLPDNGLPPFDEIRVEHYEAAFEAGFNEQVEQIRAIVEHAAPASFVNTIEALERSGGLLNRVGDVFWNLTSSDTTPELQALEMALSPRLAAHSSAIYSDPVLFGRVQAVKASGQALAPEASQLLEMVYESFVRAGAGLDEISRRRVNDIAGELATLTTQFSQNVLQDTNDFELVLDGEDEIRGLPDFALEAARVEATARGHEGKYVFTISRSSITPFLQYAERRDLREKIYQAYTSCGLGAADNHEIIHDIVALRQERAQLMGFNSHADFMLDERMAKTPGAVRQLLDRVWEPCKTKVKAEAADLQALVQAEGDNFELAPWDWWYYTEKLRHQRFDLDEEALKPYFELERVRDGAFHVAQRLYGICFERVDVPVYHPDVEAYEVRDADGTYIGLFLFDFFMRASKLGGAWMSAFREQSNLDGASRPVIVNCCNFPKSSPCLLGLDEVQTLFHEFGHGLHGLLSDVTYQSLAGTNVRQDFVELPSQIMEHWAMEPEVLKNYARHVESGEPIPDDLINKLALSETFNQGFATTEYLAACYLDMAWHESGPAAGEDTSQFESRVMAEIDKVGMIDPRYKSSYFQHIFSSDAYSAGYYVYIWAEVLDADGFEAFKENGIFDPATAQSFRQNILEKGGSVDPMTLYKQFRGHEPKVEPLLNKRGMI